MNLFLAASTDASRRNDYTILASLILLALVGLGMLVAYSRLPDRMPAAQRKLAYLGGMFVLFFFVIYLGLPAPPSRPDDRGRVAPAGGILAQKRLEHDLGETSLGNVDPASSTMNLVLLGMRGIAASSLWQTAIEHQKNKDWANLRSTLDSILLLQPYFVKVWNYQAWNMSYNVAAEWDGVADRYYWLKEGAKFLGKGINRNTKHPELYWYLGTFLGEKLGTADEWRQYRAYFRGSPGYEDPEPDPLDPEPDFTKRARRWKRGYDEELNRNGEDNYLVAKTWFEQANVRERAAQIDNDVPQVEHINALYIFLSYPQRCEISYPTALMKEGTFGEVTRQAWTQAFKGWTQVYGQLEWDTEAGKVHLELSDEERQQLEAEARKATVQRATKLHWVENLNRTVNYSFWRRLCQLESENNVDLLIPSNVEPGDEFTVTLHGHTIRHTAKSADPAEVTRGLAEAWSNARTPDGKSSIPEFDAVRPQAVSERIGAADKPVPALRLTWSAITVEHEPVAATKNGGEKDDQKLVRTIRTRSIVDAQKDLYDGQQQYFGADYVSAEQALTRGLIKFQETLREYPNFLNDQEVGENLLVAMMEWRQSRDFLEDELPDDSTHPLLPVWRVMRDNTEPAIYAELEALTAKLGMQREQEAQRMLMVKYPPLVLMMAINHRRMNDVRDEYDRRARNFRSDAKVKKKK